MPAIPLTTATRLAAWLDVDPASLRGNAGASLRGIIATVSEQIEEMCDIRIGVSALVERHSVAAGVRSIFPDSPIQSVTALRYDPQGTFFSFSELSNGNDFTVNPSRERIDLSAPWPMPYTSPTASFEVEYLGGIVYDTTETVYSATATGTPVPATVVTSSGDEFQLIAWDSVNNLATFAAITGNFREGQTITGTGWTLTLGAVVRASITNDHPMLERAALMQAAYLWERRKSAGRTSTTLGNGSTNYQGEYNILPGVTDLLTKYKRRGLRA